MKETKGASKKLIATLSIVHVIAAATGLAGFYLSGIMVGIGLFSFSLVSLPVLFHYLYFNRE